MNNCRANSKCFIFQEKHLVFNKSARLAQLAERVTFRGVHHLKSQGSGFDPPVGQQLSIRVISCPFFFAFDIFF